MMTENRNAKTSRTEGKIETNRIPERTARSLGHGEKKGARVGAGTGRRTEKKTARPSMFTLALGVVALLLVVVGLMTVYVALVT
jgi:hypothetical protein